jgi:hypothetical protein
LVGVGELVSAAVEFAVLPFSFVGNAVTLAAQVGNAGADFGAFCQLSQSR